MSAVANERERESALYAKRALPLSLSQPPHHPPPPCSPCQQGARLRKGTHVPNCKFVLSQRERERVRQKRKHARQMPGANHKGGCCWHAKCSTCAVRRGMSIKQDLSTSRGG